MTPRKAVPKALEAPDPQRWHNTTLKGVEHINAADIGRMMRFFTWDATRQIATVVTAELRQISANAESVSLTYGHLAEREETFQIGEAVAFEPRADMGDVQELRQALCDFHGITEGLP